jgi:hypothetical protein
MLFAGHRDRPACFLFKKKKRERRALRKTPENTYQTCPFPMFCRLGSRRSKGQTRSQEKQRLMIIEKLSQQPLTQI